MGTRGRNAQPVSASGKANAGDWKHGKNRADRVIRFIQGLKITSGMHAGRPFKLRPWQKAIIRAMYGGDVRQVLVTLPRKNGKTQLAAALALAHLCGPEAKSRGQVLSAAADRNQAGLIFREMRALIGADRALKERVSIKVYNKTMEDAETGSTYEALSCDARKAHGLSPSFVVCDELAQWKGRDLYENLITGSGAHADGLLVVISTKSPDPNHVMSELVRYGEQVLAGEIKDETFLPIIYQAPADADPWAEATWRACNPALGDFRSLEEMRVSAAQAKRLPAREPAFRLLYLNQPVDAASRFLNAPDWHACSHPLQHGLTGARCYLGLDLSSTTDLMIGDGNSNTPSGITDSGNSTELSLANLDWASVLRFPAIVQGANVVGTSLGWAMSPWAVRRFMSALKTPEDTASTFMMDGPTSLAGYPVAQTTALPGENDSDSPDEQCVVIFGNWSDLLIGYWSGVDLLVNPYETTAYQKGRVLIRVMRDVDVKVRHAESFAFGDDLGAVDSPAL